MIEIPEAHVVADQIEDALKGATIKKVVANHSPHKLAWYHDDPKKYPDLLMHQVIQGAKACGGMVEVITDEAGIAFAEGVRFRLQKPGHKPPKRHQLHLVFDNDLQLFCSVQMYGGLWAFSGRSFANPYYEIASRKPSPLSEAFSESYFDALIESTKQSKSLKALLATEQRIPGLGNGVLQDILFAARLHPKTKIDRLSAAQRHELFNALTKTLRTMRNQGGRDTETDLWGHEGHYTTCMSRKTHGQPCPVCQSRIERQDYMGGKIYFCPQCQVL